MAPKKAGAKRKDKRKVRTEVSSASSSDSEAASPHGSLNPEKKDAAPTRNQQSNKPADGSSDEGTDTEPVFTQQQRRVNTEQSFEDFYLRQATKEFANDLDKLRSASDFSGERSVGMLVEGLRQGTACFGREERGRVGGAGAAARGG